MWLEEIISVDRNKDINTVWEHLDLADKYAQAMLEGGIIKNVIIIALSDESLRKEILHVRTELAKFRQIAQHRYNISFSSGVGTEIDQEFDRVYQDFVDEVNNVETDLHNKIQSELSGFVNTGFALLTTSALLALIISITLLRHRKRNITQIVEIQQAQLLIEEKNKNLQAMAHYDYLTELPNRALFADLLKTAVAGAQRNEQWLILFFIDLDHFKSVNDTLGHQAGDQLLQLVAKRLKELVRAEDSVARLSGDEFTLLLAPEDTREKALASAGSVAKKVQHCLSDQFVLETSEFNISASVGIALFPKDGTSAESLLNNADRSMFDVKQMGKNNFRFFSEELEQATQRRLLLETDLRKAIQNDELELHYQPQWTFKTAQLYGLEALVRWNHPQKGMIFPDEFIGIAESCGLIHQLDMWVLETACKHLKQWEKDQVSPKQIAVNLSAIQFSSPGLVGDITDVIAKYEVDPKKLELEIIESILMEDADHTLASLKALKNQNLRIAVDDFGTGYSSMAYLSKFPVDTLKIDKMFVAEIDSSLAAKVIIESIIQMASKLGLTIVAEGIETAEQNHFLASHGCTFAQGYFYNRPMPLEDADILLRDAASIDLVKQDKIVQLFPRGE